VFRENKIFAIGKQFCWLDIIWGRLNIDRADSIDELDGVIVSSTTSWWWTWWRLVLVDCW